MLQIRVRAHENQLSIQLGDTELALSRPAIATTFDGILAQAKAYYEEQGSWYTRQADIYKDNFKNDTPARYDTLTIIFDNLEAVAQDDERLLSFFGFILLGFLMLRYLMRL